MRPTIAVHLENLLFLLLVVVAALFQLLAKTAGKASKDQKKRTSAPTPRTPPTIPSESRESDEERIRKFLEALGQPPTSKPPPPVVPRADIPPRPLAPVRPPTAHLPSPWRPAREERRKRGRISEEGPTPPSVKRREEIVRPKMTAAPAFEVHEEMLSVAPAAIIEPSEQAYGEATRTIGKTKEPRSDVATLLASTSGLRGAIILREILGPPRGLRLQMEFSDEIS